MSRKEVDQNKQLPLKDQKEIDSLITLYTPIDLLATSEVPEPGKEIIYYPILHGPGLDSLAQIKRKPQRETLLKILLFIPTLITLLP